MLRLMLVMGTTLRENMTKNRATKSILDGAKIVEAAAIKVFISSLIELPDDIINNDMCLNNETRII